MTGSARAQGGRRYRGRSTDELRAERRQRLLDAGLAGIGRRGYAGLTIERVCSDARVSTRHFYEHFGSREALLQALFERFTDDTRRIVGEALSTGDGDPMERALGAVAAFVRFALADPARARLAFIETVGVSPDMERRRRDAIGHFVSLIAGAAEQLAERGVLPRRQFHLAAVALVGATNELIVEWLSGDTGLSASQMERAIMDLFRTLIMGARARSGAAS